MCTEPGERPPLTPAEVRAQLRPMHDRISSATVPIYSRTSANNADPIVEGTGTLLRIGSYYFLMTAAHVADESLNYGRALCIRRPSDRMEFLCVGRGMMCWTTSGAVPDRFDIAAIELTPQFIEVLEARHTFLSLMDIDPTDQLSGQPSAYVISGYPTELSGPGPLVFTTNGLLFGGIRFVGDPATLEDFSPDTHVAVAWDDTGMTDGDGMVRQLPEAAGLSGGGLWRTLERGEDPATLQATSARLVGIVRRWEREPAVIIGTQIEFMIAHLAVSLPSLRPIIRIYRNFWGLYRPAWRPAVLDDVLQA